MSVNCPVGEPAVGKLAVGEPAVGELGVSELAAGEPTRTNNSDQEMLDRIIAIEETWLKYYDPKDYWASRQYRLPEQPP